MLHVLKLTPPEAHEAADADATLTEAAAGGAAPPPPLTLIEPTAPAHAPLPELIWLMGTRFTRMLASAGTCASSLAYSSPVPTLVSFRPKAELPLSFAP